MYIYIYIYVYTYVYIYICVGVHTYTYIQYIRSPPTFFNVRFLSFFAPENRCPIFAWKACMDLIGAKKRNGKTLASELEVLQ